MTTPTRPLRARRGLTFIEMVLCLFVLSMISLTAFPMTENAHRRANELELREALRTMRKAIDRYYAARAKADPASPEEARYPRGLADLVEGRYLRRIPEDPITGQADWLTVSTTDRPDVPGFVPDGRNVFDVRSRALARSARGEAYRTW